MASKKAKAFEKLLQKFPDHVCINYVFKNKKKGGGDIAYTPDEANGKVSTLRQGFEIGWSIKGTGFGGIKIYQKNGEVFIETEAMSKEFALYVMYQLIQKAKLVG